MEDKHENILCLVVGIFTLFLIIKYLIKVIMKNFFDKFFLLTLFVLSANIATGQVVEGDTVISMVILTSPVDPPDTILIRTPHQLHPDTIKVKLLISDENDVLKIIKGYIIG